MKKIIATIMALLTIGGSQASALSKNTIKKAVSSVSTKILPAAAVTLAVGVLAKKFMQTHNNTDPEREAYEDGIRYIKWHSCMCWFNASILNLYYDDLKKIDSSGRITDMYKSVPCQLAAKKKHYAITAAIGKQKTRKDEERLFELIESGLVLPCYNVLNPSISLSQTKDMSCFKLYLSDIGLFTTMLFHDAQNGIEDIYKKLLSDTLTADLGYLYENAVAQAIKASGKDLYYHTWKKEGSTHSFEIDFLITSKNKVIPIEVKSSAVKNHKSIDNFEIKYSKQVGERFLLSQKDVGKIGTLKLKPIYMILFLLKDLQ